LTLNKNSNPRLHIFEPDRAVDNTLKLIDERIASPQVGIQQNLPDTAGIVVPWRTGELIALVGYTSNGKTSLMNYIINQHAHSLLSYKQTHLDYNHICVYITWEQAIEEQTVIDLSRVTSIPASKIFKGDLKPEELEKIKGMGATSRRMLPIWLIGHSITDDRTRPRLAIENVNEMLMIIENEYKMNIDLIVLDYLQRIRRTVKSGDLREGYMDIVDQAKDMALKCPVVLLSQAKREVNSRQMPLPELDDGQETSNLEQSCDHYMSVWMPKQKHKIGAKFTWHNVEYEVDDKLIMVGFLKQKMGPAPIYRIYKMEYGGTKLTPATGRDMPTEEKKKGR